MKKNYRPEIDGLRAIAVIGVILYHTKITVLGYQPFKGGFIGVDIFFVITGFLITSILLYEHKQNKTINIINFYERRIRRLLPVLLFIIIIANIFSYFVIDPMKLRETSMSTLFSVFFAANIYFYYFANFYGDSVNLLKPLLHLWSLGVEEQFYILYPISLTIILKFFRRYILFFIILGILISFSFAVYASNEHGHFSFYMLPSRAWEILIGSFLGYLYYKKKFLI